MGIRDAGATALWLDGRVRDPEDMLGVKKPGRTYDAKFSAIKFRGTSTYRGYFPVSGFSPYQIHVSDMSILLLYPLL